MKLFSHQLEQENQEKEKELRLKDKQIEADRKLMKQLEQTKEENDRLSAQLLKQKAEVRRVEAMQ